jgi:ubiquitin C-terminal hydrolase
LTLEVKNINNLNDSLQKLIIPEIIDDFKCSNCNQSVQIKKVTSLNKLPNVLVVHLKRFYLDYETCHTRKINSKFEFPKKLNLKLFCVEEVTKNFGSTQSENTDIYNREDEYYQYELKGINVHTGSADGGHYFSFIDTNREGKDNNMNGNPENKNNWLIFNDSHVSIFDTDRIPSECYGGSNEGYSYEKCS